MFSHDQMPQVPVFSQLLIPLIQEILHPAGDMFGLGGGRSFPGFLGESSRTWGRFRCFTSELGFPNGSLR